MILNGNSKVGEAKVYASKFEWEQQKKIDELVTMLEITQQHVCELLEYSEIDKDVAHVWNNASLSLIETRKFLKELRVSNFDREEER